MINTLIRNFTLILIYSSILYSTNISFLDDILVVNTNYGKVRGAYDEKTGGKVFLGIPFAKPPVGSLRFRPPQIPSEWNDIKDAKEYGPSCYQVSGMITKQEFTSNQSEDCLYLNIWTPSIITERLAVMVWIHGGSFISGSSSEPYYNGNTLSQKGNVIVVSLNYRTGILGFMASEDLSEEDPSHPTTGNYGLLDQNLALKWVKDNIENFGGDPSNITLFGESAGAASVCLHMIMPISKNLFNRVIMQSGSCAFPNFSSKTFGNQMLLKFNYENWMNTSIKWMKEMNCEDTKCMRSLSPKAIIDYMKNTKLEINPLVDGYIIPDDPLKMFESGNYHKVDVLIGTNLHEGTLWASELIYMNYEDYKKLISKIFPNNTNEILDMYSIEKYGFPAAAYSAVRRDMMFTCNANKILTILYKNEPNVLIYQYYFTHVPEYLPKYMKFLGSYHGAEIVHVFDNPNDTHANPNNSPLTNEEKEFSYSMQEYWTSFARNGIPQAKNAPMWPTQKFDSMGYLNLNPKIMKIETNLQKYECELYEKTINIGLYVEVE